VPVDLCFGKPLPLRLSKICTYCTSTVGCLPDSRYQVRHRPTSKKGSVTSSRSRLSGAGLLLYYTLATFSRGSSTPSPWGRDRREHHCGPSTVNYAVHQGKMFFQFTFIAPGIRRPYGIRSNHPIAFIHYFPQAIGLLDSWLLGRKVMVFHSASPPKPAY